MWGRLIPCAKGNVEGRHIDNQQRDDNTKYQAIEIEFVRKHEGSDWVIHACFTNEQVETLLGHQGQEKCRLTGRQCIDLIIFVLLSVNIYQNTAILQRDVTFTPTSTKFNSIGRHNLKVVPKRKKVAS